MPIDPMNDGVTHQMYSAHIYNSVTNRYNGIKEFADNYASLGCPLILGEWTTYTGDNGSTETGYNDIEKAFQSELVYKYARANGICAIAWDIGVFEKDGRIEGGNASYWSRADLRPGFQSQLRGVYIPLTEENLRGEFPEVYSQYGISAAGGVEQKPTAVSESKITSIKCEDSVMLTIGETTVIRPEISPDNTNDILVWQTADERIATVSNGRITAKGIGKTTVTAIALNTVNYGWYGNYPENPYENCVFKNIEVEVAANGTGSEIQGIEQLELAEGSTELQNVRTANGEPMYFISQDENVAAVNEVGRVFARSIGRATISAVSYSGTVKNIKLSISKKSDINEQNYSDIGLFVLYNDASHGWLLLSRAEKLLYGLCKVFEGTIELCLFRSFGGFNTHFNK